MKQFLRYGKIFFQKADLFLLSLCVLTTIFGIVVVSSTTNYMGSEHFIFVQTMAMVIGIGLYVLFSFVDLDILAERREVLLIFNMLFIATLFIWGVEGNSGNRSWLAFSWLPFNIQPAEICKVTYILILAKTIVRQENRLSRTKSMAKLVLLFGLHVGLILVASKDAGVALIYVFVFLIMAYTAGVHWGWFLSGTAVTVALAPFVWNNFVREDQKLRIMMIFDPTIDPTGQTTRWQTLRSLNSVQGGGIMGQGLYHGTQTQAGGLAAQHNDFVFSSICEELGVVGGMAVLVMLSAIIIRCIYVGIKSGNRMNYLVCIGMAGMLLFQTAVNVGMCLGLFPVIGLTLPFVSYGGSSVVATFAAMGVVSGVKLRPAPDTQARYIRPSLHWK